VKVEIMVRKGGYFDGNELATVCTLCCFGYDGVTGDLGVELGDDV
jgi:hypothetical protein